MFDAFFILERLKSMDQRPSGFLGLLLLQLIKMATDLRLSQKSDNAYYPVLHYHSKYNSAHYKFIRKSKVHLINNFLLDNSVDTKYKN